MQLSGSIQLLDIESFITGTQADWLKLPFCSAPLDQHKNFAFYSRNQNEILKLAGFSLSNSLGDGWNLDKKIACCYHISNNIRTIKKNIHTALPSLEWRLTILSLGDFIGRTNRGDELYEVLLYKSALIH